MTDLFTHILNKIAIRAEQLEGDYYVNGILYCGKCNTPKESKQLFTFNGQSFEKIVRVACKCADEEAQREKERNEINKRKESIMESLRNLVEMGAARMPEYDWSKFDHIDEKLCGRMHKYAENFEQCYDKNIGLMLYGGTGTGKTFYAECIANELLQKGRFAWLTSVSGIVNAMQNETYRATIMHYVKNVDLLILDDFGTERDTSYMSENIYNIVDARYVSKRPLIITTNIDKSAMMANSDIRIRRIGERLAESCVAIEVKGTTRRSNIAKEKVSQLKEIFGE